MSVSPRLVLLVLVVAALALRLIGLQYGLPSVYNPDEIAITARALSFAKGTLNPHNFLYPTFYFYVLFGWIGTYLGVVWLTGGVSSVTALQQLYFTEPVGIYTAGRLLGALLGTACVPAVYALGRRLFDVGVGLGAAAFLTVAPLAVRDSHYIKHDIPATLAVIVAMIAIVRVWPRGVAEPGRNDGLVAGAACGVAFSTHYYCIFLALPLGWAIFQRWHPLGWRIVARHMFTAGLISGVVFFALSPFILFEPLTAWRDITANRAIVIDRAVESGAFAPAARYAEMLWTDSAGKAVVAVGAAGAGLILVTAPARAVLLLAFPVAFFAFISNTAPASRYLNPMLPFVVLLGAWMLASVADALRAGRTAFVIAIAAWCVMPAVHSLRTGLFFRADDTRTQAEQFIKANISPGSTILIQPQSTMLVQSREALVEALTRHLGSPRAASKKFQIQLSLDPYPQPSYRLIYVGRGGLDVDRLYVDPATVGLNSGLAPLRQLGVTHVVLKRYNESSEFMEFATELSRHGRVIAAFSPYKPGVSEAERLRIAPFLHNTDTRIDDALERPGPPVEVWQLR